MKRAMSIVLVVILLISIISTKLTYAIDNQSKEKMYEANEYLESELKKRNYFKEKNDDNKPINEKYIKKGIIVPNYPIFAYGTEHEASVDANAGKTKKGSQYRCLGYTMDGSLFSNPNFPADYKMTPFIENKKYVKEPWNKTDISLIRRFIKEEVPPFDESCLPGDKKDIFRDSIKYGIGLAYGLYHDTTIGSVNEEKLRKDIVVLSNNYSGGYLNGKFINMDWEKYTHIIQPPTSKAWGLGMLFHEVKNGKYRYFTVPLVPMDLISSDLIANFEGTKKFAVVGQEITITAKISSTYKEKVNSIYNWDIKDEYGNDVQVVKYEGHGKAQSGEIKNITPKGENLFRATFIMPSSDVVVKFRVNNEEGEIPLEKNLANNLATMNIEKVMPSKITSPNNELGYNVLSRKFSYELNSGEDIIAKLPSRDWTGNTTGELIVNLQDDPPIFNNFNIINNPYVDEPSETIVRNPKVKAEIKRISVGDNPGYYWLENFSNPVRNPYISFYGEVSRPYRYWCSHENEEYSHWVYDTEYADFIPGQDNFNITIYVYNGRENMPNVAERNFRTEVENNTSSSTNKKLFWISDSHDFTVQRWMRHLDENGETYKWEPRDGQYKRTFNHQNTADITFKVENSMDELYKPDRCNAKFRKQRKNWYTRVPFASDRDLQRYDYPFKSGYYFNPAGVYSITVKTVVFKYTNDNTPEHIELVDKLIDSFRYGSNLEYTTDGMSTYTINYMVKEDPRVNNKPMLEVDNYKINKDVEEIYYSREREGKTHKYIKQVLEGYMESNTQDSYDNYSYREHLKSGHIYKITEESKITITVNPYNQKIYTYANMKNGNYYMKAWFENFTYKNLNVKGLKKENSPLDNINIKVHGSMFDDLNN